MSDGADTSYFHANPHLQVCDLSAGALLREVATQMPGRVALTQTADPRTGRKRSWTYAEFLDNAERTARGLLEHYRPGDHVAIWAHNIPEWSFVEFGAALAGIVLVTINPASREKEVAYIVENSGAVALITVRECRGTDHLALIDRVKRDLPMLRDIWIIDDWEEFMAAAPSGTPLPVVRPEDPVMIQYTSGTTGKPKGARLCHRGIVNSSKFATECFAVRDGAVWMNCVPMFHTGGSVHSTMGAIWSRGTLVQPPFFDPGVMLRAIEEERVTLFTNVPTMTIALLEHPDFEKYDYSSLDLLACGGAPVAPALVERVEREFDCDFVMLFGQTEMSGMICQSVRGDTIEHVTQTVGMPLGPVEVRIAHSETGETLSQDEIGEICLRSPNVLLDYYGNPDATAKAIDDDGWFHTGDLGTVRPDHYLTITGRLKDMLIRGGENIYPREIEDELLTHPAVVDAAVFGVPDARWGEQIAAAIRLREGEAVSEAELIGYLQSRIAKFKVPSRWWFVASFPTTLSGKVQKFALRDQYIAQFETA